MTRKDLKAWRARLGITQEAAAELIGVSLDTIRRMEQGRSSIGHPLELACRYIETANERAETADALRALADRLAPR